MSLLCLNDVDRSLQVRGAIVCALRSLAPDVGEQVLNAALHVVRMILNFNPVSSHVWPYCVLTYLKYM